MTSQSRQPSPPWTPPCGLNVVLLPAGKWWDAVRVPEDLGAAALELLGDRTGAVIEDTCGAIWYWLIAPGSVGGWGICDVQILGDACYVVVPPQDRTENCALRWRVPLVSAEYLTDPDLLRDALGVAAAHLQGARSVRAGQGADR